MLYLVIEKKTDERPYEVLRGRFEEQHLAFLAGMKMFDSEHRFYLLKCNTS